MEQRRNAEPANPDVVDAISKGGEDLVAHLRRSMGADNKTVVALVRKRDVDEAEAALSNIPTPALKH
jgi:hypothetical protein